MNSEEYRKISDFKCCGKDMVVLRGGNSRHVMTMKKWRVCYSWMHPERWAVKNKKI